MKELSEWLRSVVYRQKDWSQRHWNTRGLEIITVRYLKLRLQGVNYWY